MSFSFTDVLDSGKLYSLVTYNRLLWNINNSGLMNLFMFMLNFKPSQAFIFIFLKNIWFFFFFWLHLWQMEAPRPGIKSKPQLWPTLSLWQHRILNPFALGWGLNPCCSRDNTVSLTHCTTAGTPLTTSDLKVLNTKAVVQLESQIPILTSKPVHSESQGWGPSFCSS